MESPGPGCGHRGFLVQRNHESGGIVIVFSLPERCNSGNSVISTFCNRDIFTIPKSDRAYFKVGHYRITASTSEPAATFRGNENGIIDENGECFPRLPTSEPRHGGAGALGLTTFTGGVRGVCSPLARRSLTPGW
jgi:hypothetical protein